MRITKVKIGDDMVLMHRTNTKGILILENSPKVDNTKYILPNKKQDSFRLSVKNKTVVKKGRSKAEKIRPQIEEIVAALVKINTINNKTELPKLDKCSSLEDIRLCLGHKFKQDVKYKDDNNNIVSFNLAGIIHEYSETNNATLFRPYIIWKEWYIKNKSNNLIKSINNNVIDTNGDTNISTRKKALKDWESEYVSGSKIDLKALENSYEINKLVGDFNTEKKKTYQNNFEFHRALKQALQQHQKTIFGRNNGVTPEEVEENDKLKLNRTNNKLCVYHLEIVKYLEHYFPIKSTKRKNSNDDIDYYLKENTIKSTVRSQIENAIRANLLQQGKVAHHDLNQNTTSSDTLSMIKRQEAFVLNLIGACAFAANNIRNIVDREQSQDILGKKEFNKSLGKESVDDRLFKFFYCPKYDYSTNNLLVKFFNCSKYDYSTNLWGMRGAVQQIRNNIFHYKSDSIDTVFDISRFETNQTRDEQYSNSIFKSILEDEIKNIPTYIAEQLKSGGILSYYNLNDIKNLLNKCTFSVCRSSLPFTPGFKKVANGGRGYQYSSGDKNGKKYNMGLKYYLDKNTDKNKEQQYQAHYFLLKLLYNNMFLPYFTDKNNIVAFKKAVDFVRDVNKKFAADKPYKFAFKDVREMNEKDTISGYMSYVQSQFIQEKNKKGVEDSNKRINFENFLLQIFIKGFDSYLESKKLDFIRNPEFQFEIGITDKDKATKLNGFEKDIVEAYKFNDSSINIEVDNDSHIAFFTFCKLLNSSHLSNLRNELIKFRQTGQFEFHHIIEIIELCLLSADKSFTVWNELCGNKDEWSTHVKKFVEANADISKWGNLFLQDDSSTPIVHANISLCLKYGTEQLLERIVANHKLKKSDYDEWIEVGKSIAEDTRKRDGLHAEWVEAKREDDTIEKKKRFNAKNFISTNAGAYISLCNKIDAYNWLDNKMHFVHLNKLHNLIIDILSRMVGFVSLWDRDFQILDAHRTSDDFQLKGAISFRAVLKNLNSNKDINEIEEIAKEEIIKRDCSNIDESDRSNLINCLGHKKAEYEKVFFKAETNPFDSRNQIAHFEYLYKNHETFSLIKPINDLRDMFNYDRKLKNAVTKSIIDLFDKNGMMLTLKLDGNAHQIILEDIKPKKIYHLGSKEITTDHVNEEFCNICKKLF